MHSRLSGLLLLALGAISVRAEAQTRIVTGRVVDSLTNEAVPSGQVTVTGSNITATIRDDGTFTVAVPERDVTLSVRSIGFKRRDVTVTAQDARTQVALARDYFQLEAIVVTGQATGVEKRNLANAVATVGSQDLVRVPAQSVEHALTGKVAGADIQQNTSAPGGGVRVKLRGQTTLTGAYTPLYVIDGVIVSDASIAPGANIVTKASTTGGVIAVGAENNTNRIADLNPNDIESVEVLKGAAASAIYGSKASNGVILITTKRGRVGAPQYTVNQRFGVSQISRKMGLRRFTSVADAVDAKGPLATSVYQDAFFDHEEELYGREPLSYETTASVSGGSDNTRYFASGLVKHDGGIVNHTFYDKQSMRLNLDQNIGPRVTLGAGAQVVHSTAARGLFHNDNSGTSYGMVLPHTPSYIDLRAVCPDGTRKVECPGGVYPTNPFVASNPLQTAALLDNAEDVWRSILSGNLAIELVRSSQHTLRVMSNGGVDFFQQNDRLYSPPELHYEDDDGLPGTVSLGNAQNTNMNLNGNLVHVFKSGGLAATTSAGMQLEWRDLDVVRNVAQNLLGGLANINSGSVSLSQENRTYTKDQGVFVQEEVLTLREHLLLTAGLRADRSSNNGDPTKYFYYPKAAASYRFTTGGGLLSELKLRAAFGQSGNQPLYSQKETELSGGNISSINAVTIGGRRGASDLHPERQREIESGFDATVFGGRATVEVTGYEKRITDLLLNRSLPPYTGFSSEIFNGGVMRTRGFEAALNLVPIQTASVQWSTRANFAKTKSKITSLPVPEYRTGSSLVGFHVIKEGYSPTEVWGFDSTYVPGPGQLDVVLLGDKEPTFTLGISNDLTIKPMRLYFLVDWKKGGIAGDGAYRHFNLSLNAAKSCEIRVQPSNKCYGKELIDAGYARKSTTALVYDNSWVKLREITLSMDLPKSLGQKLWSGVRFIRLSVSGRNLLMFTPWRGYDPEGVESGFNASPTRELGPYPPSRSLWASIDFGF
ncbi:MAG: SusC/RagA family TonB-linked outer membrane protein [Gemmatimonadetes bacterium]|nr:SusC/RagA family TonB-linked outer membrane protein [Gemmatimonadota bacterium]